MKYTAIIRKEKGSCFGVEFPDVPGCHSGGNNLDEATEVAGEALRLHLGDDETTWPEAKTGVFAALASLSGEDRGAGEYVEIRKIEVAH